MNNNIKFLIPKDKKEISYIGFNLEEDNSTFAFPCQYFDDTKLTLQEKISTYKKEAKSILSLLKGIKKEYLFGGDNSELFQFHSMIWLIQDFIDHGYYNETEIVSDIKQNGKINWKKTIKNNSFFFNNNNIIYKKFVRDKTIINSSQFLVQIYKACLKYSVERIGFILGVEKTEGSIFNIETCDKSYLNHHLNIELNSTFNDYKKSLINHLLSIINNQNSKIKNNGFSIYDNEFEYIFEYLINKTFGTENVKDFYNSYAYYIPERISASKLRPDTIMKYENTYYIIDAKYYNYGYTQNHRDLPQASSISKQISYNHYLQKSLPNGKNIKVKSIFLLPYSSKKEGEYLKYVGYAKQDNNNDENDKIAICLVELKELVDTFILRNNNLTPKLLVKTITNGG